MSPWLVTRCVFFRKGYLLIRSAVASNSSVYSTTVQREEICFDSQVRHTKIFVSNVSSAVYLTISVLSTWNQLINYRYSNTLICNVHFLQIPTIVLQQYILYIAGNPETLVSFFLGGGLGEGFYTVLKSFVIGGYFTFSVYRGVTTMHGFIPKHVFSLKVH